MRDVYYSPEKFDLEVVAEIEMSPPDYSFDIVMVWRHTPTGKLYWAADSGCSCPSPFEDYNSLDKLDVLNGATLAEFERYVASASDQGARMDAVRKIREVMGGATVLHKRRWDGTEEEVKLWV